MTAGRSKWCYSWLTNSDLTESTTAGWTIPGDSSRARRFMTRNWTAPVCVTHWPKRERSACLSGGPQGTLQAVSPNVADADYRRCGNVSVRSSSKGRATAFVSGATGATGRPLVEIVQRGSRGFFACRFVSFSPSYLFCSLAPHDACTRKPPPVMAGPETRPKMESQMPAPAAPKSKPRSALWPSAS